MVAPPTAALPLEVEYSDVVEEVVVGDTKTSEVEGADKKAIEAEASNKETLEA